MWPQKWDCTVNLHLEAADVQVAKRKKTVRLRWSSKAGLEVQELYYTR